MDASSFNLLKPSLQRFITTKSHMQSRNHPTAPLTLIVFKCLNSFLLASNHSFKNHHILMSDSQIEILELSEQ